MTKYYSRSKGKFVDIATMPDQYVRNAFVKMCKHEPTEDVIFGEQQRERADKYKKLAEDNFVSSVADLDKIESLIKQNNKLQGMYDKLKDTTKDIIKEKDSAILNLRSELENTTYQPYDNEGRVRDYQVEYSKVVKERDSYKKKANEMEMAKMTINRDLLDAKDKLKDTVSKQAYQVMWDNCEKLKKDYKYVNDRMMMYAEMLNSLSPKGKHYVFSEIPNTDEGKHFVSLLKKYLNNVSYKLRVRGQYLNDETKKTEGWRRYTYGQPIEKSKCLRVYVDINSGDLTTSGFVPITKSSPDKDVD